MQIIRAFKPVMPLLMVIGVLTLVAFAIGMATLFAGITPQNQDTSIIEFNTTSVNSSLFPIPDWYEVHYLSVCSGRWQAGSFQTVKAQSSRTCVRQIPGYTFSLDEVLSQAKGNNLVNRDASSTPAQLMSTLTLKTAIPVGLLTGGIALAGLSGLLLVYSTVALRIKGKPPLFLMRVAYVASIPAAILFTISSGKITVLADRLAGTWETEYGQVINAWKGTGFYAETWVVVAVMWLAVGLSIAVAFSLADSLNRSRHVRLGA